MLYQATLIFELELFSIGIPFNFILGTCNFEGVITSLLLY